LIKDGAPFIGAKLQKNGARSNGLGKLEWPAQSPDLNAIENIWMHMKDHIQKRKPSVRSTEKMKEALKEAWNAVDSDNRETHSQYTRKARYSH